MISENLMRKYDRFNGIKTVSAFIVVKGQNINRIDPKTK